MNVSRSDKKGYCIVTIEGRIDTGNFNEFEKEILSIIDTGQNLIVLNCSGLDYISSSGLRVFLITQKKLMSTKGTLHLSNMQPSIKEIFDISGFSTIFKIFDTEEEAIA